MTTLAVGTPVTVFSEDNTDYQKGVVTQVNDKTYHVMTPDGEINAPHNRVSRNWVPLIVIQVEGGAVQAVLDYNDALEDVDVLIFDYDNMPEED